MFLARLVFSLNVGPVVTVVPGLFSDPLFNNTSRYKCVTEDVEKLAITLLWQQLDGRPWLYVQLTSDLLS